MAARKFPRRLWYCDLPAPSVWLPTDRDDSKERDGSKEHAAHEALPAIHEGSDRPKNKLIDQNKPIDCADEAFEKALGRTLEDVHFPFGDAEANRRIDDSRYPLEGIVEKGLPLELGVFDLRAHTQYPTLATRVLQRDLPACGLIRLDADLYCASPELVLCQLARDTEMEKLAQLAMELCGRYSMCPSAGEGERTCEFDCAPVTSVERIYAFQRRVRRLRGRAKLEEALRYALNASASPGESTLALMMTLPADLGGYGLAGACCNAELEVPLSERGHVGQSSYELDLFWQRWMVDLEYESAEFHLDPFGYDPLLEGMDADDIEAWRRRRMADAERDRRRMRDIAQLGVCVVPVMPADIASRERLDQVGWSIARNAERRGNPALVEQMSLLGDVSYRAARTGLLDSLRDCQGW